MWPGPCVQTTATGYRSVATGAHEWQTRLAMVREARRYLYLATYYLEHDAYSQELLRCMADAARRGVTVWLAYDRFGHRLGTASVPAARRRELEAEIESFVRAGGRVTVLGTTRTVLRLLGAGNHIKVQLSDAGSALFGSSNISGRSMQTWGEYSALVTGPVVDLLRSWFLSTVGGPSTDTSDPPSDPGAIPLTFQWHDPAAHQPHLWPLLSRANVLTDAMVNALDSAQNEIWITSFYFKPAPRLLDAVLRACARGVNVHIAHSHRDALNESDLPWLASAADHHELLRAGAQITEVLRGEHSKVVVIDNRWGAFGSYNFEHAADDRLAEAMLSTEHPRIVSELAGYARGVAQHRDAVAASLGWPPSLRLKVALARPARRWL